MRQLYHLSCDNCGYDWWDPTGFPAECPNCHKDPYKTLHQMNDAYKKTKEPINECCATCARCFKAKKSDYSQSGCKDSDMDGFICMCFADEDIAVWMVGIGQNEQCEMYTPKGEYRLTWTKNTPKI